MKRRSRGYIIEDIKNVRRFTGMLGKLGINECRSSYTDSLHGTIVHHYGAGLKDAKDYVERLFQYYSPGEETEADILETQRVLRNTRSTWKLMRMLEHFTGNAHPSLSDCRMFALRMKSLPHN